VDAEIEESSVEDVIQCEDRIVSQWREVSADEQHELCERFDEILRPLGFRTRLQITVSYSGGTIFDCRQSQSMSSVSDVCGATSTSPASEQH